MSLLSKRTPARTLVLLFTTACATASAPNPPAKVSPVVSIPGAAELDRDAADILEVEVRADAADDAESTHAPVEHANQTVCELVCERAQVLPRITTDDHTARATEKANEVLDAMRGDLLACYKKRLIANPAAHGFITVDIVVHSTGHVGRVETTGGAVLGDDTMQCIVGRIQRATFEPPHGGGTMLIHVPFSLRRIAPGDEPL